MLTWYCIRESRRLHRETTQGQFQNWNCDLCQLHTLIELRGRGVGARIHFIITEFGKWGQRICISFMYKASRMDSFLNYHRSPFSVITPCGIRASYLGWIAPQESLLLKHCLEELHLLAVRLKERSNTTYKVIFTNKTIP